MEDILARQRKTSPPPRECSVVSDVFEEDRHLNNVDTPSEGEGLLNQFATNLHRIDKDVDRVMCTYVRRNLDEGYIQGMCDILAPLLVIFEDEALTLECFTIIMARLRENFPQRSGMDQCLANLRSLIQVVDPQIFSLLTSSSDFTHLYFSYRWFLLDFKRDYNVLFF
uniref:Rab-GAP TBC domain-containing protein n=1 Tax=Heterorhabditis bacteriophora TaxID=37862 RepID=A0A1I7XTF1_HETBA